MGQFDYSSLAVVGSGYAGIDYRVFFSEPSHPASASSPTRVIYALDGNWLFPIVAAYVKTLRLFEPGFENAAVIGIGYDTDDDAVINQLRVSDLAPVESNLDGVARFRDFITGKVKELVSERCRISQSRDILVGHSWGGAFALFTLFSAPEAFDGYLSCSPPVYESDLLDLEEQFSEKPEETHSQLLLCVGGDEGRFLAGVLEMARQLEGRAYKDLSFASQVFEDENHSSVIMPAIAKGLRELFEV